MEVEDLCGLMDRAYICLIVEHVSAAIKFVHNPSVPIIVIIEQNTYANCIDQLFASVRDVVSVQFNRRIFAYHGISKTNKLIIGKLVSTNKSTMVLALRHMMTFDKIGRVHALLSFQSLIRSAILEERKLLTKRFGATLDAIKIPDPDYVNVIPTDIEEFRLLSPNECVRFVMSYRQRTIQTQEMYTTNMVEEGTVQICKLRDELMAITIKCVGAYPKVFTGGKRQYSGSYTKDDLFSAFLLGATAMIGDEEQYQLR